MRFASDCTLDGYFPVQENPCVSVSLVSGELRIMSAVTGAPSTEMRGAAQASQRLAVATT